MNSKKLILTFSLFIIITYISFFLHTYTQPNYYLQYNIHDVYDEIDKEIAHNATNNLITYFLHINELNTELFNQKEIRHFEDVRQIYGIYFILTIFSIITLHYLKPNKKQILQSLKLLRYLILTPIIVIPFFALFWNKIFHSILFSNSYWITYPGELSYYLFPLEFFTLTLISIILMCEIITFLAIYYFKNSKFINN